MKDSIKYAPRLKKLYNRLNREASTTPKTDLTDPCAAIVLACLSAVTTENKARLGFSRLRHNFVDFNELRVSRFDEVADILGKGYPQCKEVAKQIISLLKQIYNARDSLNLDDLREGSKRQAKAFFESLEGVNAYIVARVMLLSIGSHAFPVHKQMLQMLRGENVVSAKANASDVQGFLERQIPASQNRKIYALLRRRADNFRVKCAGKTTGTAKSAKSTKKTTKRTKNTPASKV
ncbi:MAG: hypothetical protein KAT56_11520 [Sedimentisphaerales bacterium]|nr:hypothetical protein [Sedimentisphaerales bacterium]